MNKKILGFFVSLFAIVMLATPVMAAPAERIPLSATFEWGPPHREDAKWWMTEGGVIHEIGVWREGTVTLNIGAQTLVGDCYFKWHLMINTKTGVLIGHEDVVFTFSGGTFVGQRNRKNFDFIPPSTCSWITYNLLMDGTGDFRGQTLKFSYDGPPPVLWEGVAIIPNN